MIGSAFEGLKRYSESVRILGSVETIDAGSKYSVHLDAALLDKLLRSTRVHRLNTLRGRLRSLPF